MNYFWACLIFQFFFFFWLWWCCYSPFFCHDWFYFLLYSNTYILKKERLTEALVDEIYCQKQYIVMHYGSHLSRKRWPVSSLKFKWSKIIYRPFLRVGIFAVHLPFRLWQFCISPCTSQVLSKTSVLSDFLLSSICFVVLWVSKIPLNSYLSSVSFCSTSWLHGLAEHKLANKLKRERDKECQLTLVCFSSFKFWL